jgi:hypothetical protein
MLHIPHYNKFTHLYLSSNVFWLFPYTLIQIIMTDQNKNVETVKVMVRCRPTSTKEREESIY